MEIRPTLESGSTMARSRVYLLQKAAWARLNGFNDLFISSDCRSHSSRVNISRQSSKMSFLTTNFIGESEGSRALNGEGKTILPLSSIFAVYSPMNLIIGFKCLSRWLQRYELFSISFHIITFFYTMLSTSLRLCR